MAKEFNQAGLGVVRLADFMLDESIDIQFALTYCCVDTTVRQYSRFGLLFARNGNWNGEQIISAARNPLKN